MIIVTHNMQQAARVSDTTSFFYLGEMVETGPTERIFTAPEDERLQASFPGSSAKPPRLVAIQYEGAFHATAIHGSKQSDHGACALPRRRRRLAPTTCR